MRGWLSSVIVIALLALAPAERAADCPQAEISSTASRLQDARNALMLLAPGKDQETAIPRQTQSAIADLKARLAEFILAYMRCQSENADVEGIEVDLSRLGWARSLEPGRVYRNDEMPPHALDPGWSLSFETRPLGQGLIGITATFGIPCGGDTMLMIFQHSDEGWSEIMRVSSPPYRDVAGSYQAFDYAISPPDSDGDWFLVEKHLPTSCISTLSGIAYSVLRPAANPLRPKVLFTGHGSLSWADEDFGRLSVGADYFEIRFHDFDSDTNLVEIVRRYSVAGQTVAPVRNPGWPR